MLLKTILVLGLGVLAGALSIILTDSITSDGDPIQSKPKDVSSRESINSTGFIILHDTRKHSDLLLQCSENTMNPDYLMTLERMGYEILSQDC